MFLFHVFLDNVLENAACLYKGQMTSNHLFYSMSQINFYKEMERHCLTQQRKKITCMPLRIFPFHFVENQDIEHFFYNFKSKSLTLGHVSLC